MGAMRSVRLGLGAALALSILTTWLGACSSSATACGANGNKNGTCQSGPACSTGSREIPISDPFDMCPGAGDLGGPQGVCCEPFDSGPIVAGDGGSSIPDSTTMTTKDSTVTPDATSGVDSGTDSTVPPTPDSGQPADTGSPPDAGHDAGVDTGTPDTGTPDSGTGDTGKTDSGHDAGVDSSTLLGLGGACTAGTQCAAGNCANGVCCDTSCAGTCQACTAALTGGTNGTCADVTAGKGPTPASQCTAAPVCGNTGTCDGLGACSVASATTSCVTASCSNGELTSAGTCDGLGSCAGSVTAPCLGGFMCASATACKTACAADTDCQDGNYCLTPGAAGTCIPQLPGLSACTADDQCVNGMCVLLVCN
jgi:hypothetical protein